jgi:PAS domain S-box-containing protein
MGQVRALPAKAVTARASATVLPDVQSTVFDYKGAILFQNEAARRNFAAPRDAKRAACAFVRHFADRAEGRHLFERAAAGQSSRGEKLVHTAVGVARRLVEVSCLAGPDDETAIMLSERPADPAAATDRDAEAVRMFAQAGADWFWETDAEMRFTSMSDRPDLAVTSFSADLIGRVLYEPLAGIDGLDYDGLRDAIEKRAVLRDFRFTRRDRDGRRRHFSVSGAPFFAPDGAFLGYRGTGRDRTRSVEAEENAATAQARLIAAIESIPESFVLFDRDQRLVMCNSRFREENAPFTDRLRAGVTAADIAIAARRAGRTVPAIDYVAAGTHTGRGHISVERQAGDRWFQLGARRLPEGGIAVVQTDVTALKRREAELAEKSALLQATLENMHQGILVNDADGKVVMWNHRFLEMNGLRSDMIRASMPGRELVRSAAKLGEYGDGDVEGFVTQRLEQLGRPGVATMRVRPDGTVIENHANRMPGGMVIRTFTDITQIKQQERESEDQRRLLSATLSNMDQGMLVLDTNMRIRLWNPRLFELMQVPETLCHVGMTLAELIAAMRQAQGFAAGDFGDAATARLKDRKLAPAITLAAENFGGRTIERRRRPLPDGGMVLTYTDVTEAKLHEREIAEKSALLAATLEGMDQGIMVADANGKVRMWNERLVEQYGLPRGFLRVGMSTDEVVEQLARQGEFGEGDPVALAKARIAAIDSPTGLVFARRLKSGRVIERRRRTMPDGSAILTHTDITALAERESEIAEKSALLSMVLESMDQGIMVLDADRSVRMWNSRVIEQHALPPDFMKVGMPGSEVIHQLARQGEYGASDPEMAARQRAGELERDPSLVFQRRHSNGLMIERRRRPMPGGGTVLTFTDITALTERERALEEKSALLTAALDNMDQGMIVLDANLNVRGWNNHAVELLALPPDFVRAGMPLTDLIRFMSKRIRRHVPGDLEQHVAGRAAEICAGGVRIMAGLSPNGVVLERRSRAMPDGGVVITYADITALNERELALEEKSAHLSAVLGSMDQGMLVLDKDAKIQTWNARVEELLNLPSDWLRIGMPATELTRWLSIRLGQSPAEIERSIAQRLHEMLAGETRMLGGPSLDNRVVERRSLPMPDGGVVVTYSDVTERKRREDLLAENSALLTATLDNMDQGLVVIDADNRTKLWNNRLIEMFDLPPDLMRRSRPFVEVLRFFIESYGTPPDQVEARVAERMAELQGEPAPVIDRHRPDGRVIERRRRVMPTGGSVITYGDVTMRKRGEAALQRAKEEAEIASRSKTEFLANMSHELRTPLNAIIGFSDILVRQLFGPLGTERYVEYAKDIHDSGQHLLNLINDVLDISKIEFNKVELAEETIDVPAVIESCLRLMRDRATAAGVVIDVTMPEILPPLRGDDRRLKQILLNLVSNAVKFTPSGGRVEIRVDADDSGFRFVVADTGIGIAKSDLEIALRPFGQIDSSLARRYQGTGLGLPLARSMAELHGGKLDVESEPGIGTTVTVWLPLVRTTP